MFKRVSTIVLSLIMVLCTGYFRMYNSSSAESNESGDSKIDFITPHQAYNNLKDKSYYYKVKYDPVCENATTTISTYMAWYMDIPDYGITKDMFDEEDPEKVLFDPKEEGAPVFKSMIKLDIKESDSGAEVLNYGDIDSIKYGLYNNITKKFVDKRDIPIKFMKVGENSQIQYPNVNKGETKKIRIVYDNEYWLGTITKNEDETYKIKFYAITESSNIINKTEKDRYITTTYNYKYEDKDIINADSEEKNIEKGFWEGGKVKYKLKEVEFDIKNLSSEIAIKRISNNLIDKRTIEEDLNLVIDPNFDYNYNNDSIGLKKIDLRGGPVFASPNSYIKNVEELYLKNIYTNSFATSNELSFIKNGGYNVEDEYRYTIDGSEPRIDSKELRFDPYFFNEYHKYLYRIEFNEDEEGVGYEKIDDRYLEGGKLTLKVKSFRNGIPNSDTFTYTLNINKKSINVTGNVIPVLFNGIKSEDEFQLVENLYAFDKWSGSHVYYDTKVMVDRIDIDEKVKSSLKDKKIGRYYPISIKVLDKDDKEAKLPYGWNSEQQKKIIGDKPPLAIDLLKLKESDISPIKINKDTVYSIYEIKENGDIEKVVDDYNQDYFKYGVKCVNKILKAKIPVKDPTSKFIIAEENSYDNSEPEKKEENKKEDNKKDNTEPINKNDTTEEKKEDIKKDDSKASRLSGDDRYETSVKISKENFKSANTVILASGVNSADALSASSLASSKSAPILLTKKKSLDENVIDEIKRLGAKSVIVVGGSESVSSKVLTKIKDEKIDVKRISGDDRYETSQKIARELLKSEKARNVILVNGFKNADALSVSSLATKENLPIIMNDSNQLSKDTKRVLEDLNIKKVYIIGGKNSLSNRIEKNIESMDIDFDRLSGKDRYETSSEIAKYAYNTSDNVIIASGENSVDALCAGAITKKQKAPMLLVEKNRVPRSISKRIEETKVKKAIIIGGEKTIRERVVDKILDTLN